MRARGQFPRATRPIAEVALSDIVTVGRSKHCTVAVANPYLSEVHCQINLVDGHWTVHDHRSSNGTFVNGERSAAGRPLVNGDVVSLGPVGAGPIALEFVDDGSTLVALLREIARLRELVDGHERRLATLEAGAVDRRERPGP